jgi:Rieske Fe-S protein
MDDQDGPEAETRRQIRRALLRTLLGAVPAIGLTPCVARDVAAQDSDPRSRRPQPGDRFVPQADVASARAIAAGDLVAGGPPIVAYPLDAATGVVRDGSRLNQVLLVRLAPDDLTEETRQRSAEGIVAYSGVCTHAGCDVALWTGETRRFRCPCHESEFDPREGGRVVGGPAPRRLPTLPVKVVEGFVVADGGFIGRPGFQSG